MEDSIISGNKIGGLKAAEKNTAQDPDFYKRIGALGGKKKVPKGFALMDVKKRSEAGRRGGSNGRRGKKNEQV